MKFSLVKIMIAMSAIAVSTPSMASILVCSASSKTKALLMNKDKATCLDVKTKKYYILSGGGVGAGNTEAHGKYIVRCSANDPTGINGGLRLGFGNKGFLLSLGRSGGCAFSILSKNNSNDAAQRMAFDGFKISEANEGISAKTMTTLEQMADEVINPKKPKPEPESDPDSE